MNSDREMLDREMKEFGDLERTIGRVLWLGVLGSSLCLGIGLVLALADGNSGAARLLLGVGLVTLLATPAARVIVSVIEYARARDWLFVLLTVSVLAELVASLVAALHGRK